MTRERARHDYFSRDPHRLVAALLHGELSWHAYSVVSFLINVIDHGQEPRPCTVESLDDLLRRVRFPLGKRTLLRALHEAQERTWIRFAPPKGSARAYSFTLGAAAIDGLACQSDVTPEGLARHSVVTPGVTDEAHADTVSPHEDGDGGGSLAGHPRACAEEASEEKREETSSLRSDVSRDDAFASSAGEGDPASECGPFHYDPAAVLPEPGDPEPQGPTLDGVLDSEVAQFGLVVLEGAEAAYYQRHAADMEHGDAKLVAPFVEEQGGTA